MDGDEERDEQFRDLKQSTPKSKRSSFKSNRPDAHTSNERMFEVGDNGGFSSAINIVK